jgi:hypothetical protein
VQAVNLPEQIQRLLLQEQALVLLVQRVQLVQPMQVPLKF